MDYYDGKEVLRFADFEEEVSLWNLVLPGNGAVRRQFEDIIDSLENRYYHTVPPLTVLIVGKEGKKLHAAALLRALDKTVIKSAPARYFIEKEDVSSLLRYSESYMGYIVSDFEPLNHLNYKLLNEIITEGTYTIWDNHKKSLISYFVNNPIIVTAEETSLVPECMLQKFQHIVFLQDYTSQQIRRIIRQRIDYCRLDYDDHVVGAVMQRCNLSLKHASRLLEACITSLQAKKENRLTQSHIERVIGYMSPYV